VSRKIHAIASFTVVAASIAVAGCGTEEQASSQLASTSCGTCHAEQLQRWSDSHHALAEQELPAGTIVVNDVGPDGQPHEYEALRSIGVDPLVQYIVELDGRLQVPQQARDFDDDSWFDVFADGRGPGEWGHWTGRGMNWDTMCAVCHNTDLQREWSAEQDSFDTTWLEHGVGCTACHSDAADHARDEQAPIPTPSSESCWPCHARRSELVADGPGDHFLDRYFPGLPDFNDTWHVDGQIRDEDFEYTSFALSKMHAVGVTCLDCHDPHTAKLRIPGDTLCMTCHSGGGRVPAPIVSTDTHSGHQAGTPGSKCVDCHMTTTVYMQRHPRHDHGFLVPDPQLSIETGVPNACNKCHTDKTNEWAAAIVEARPTWKGNVEIRRRARAMFAARSDHPDALSKLLEATEQETQPTWRAALLGMLQAWPEDQGAQRLLVAAASSDDPLQRALAWPLPELLDDPVRAVRLNAARALPPQVVDNTIAGADLLNSLRHNRGQPSGAMQEAQYHLARGNAEQAIVMAQYASRWERTSPAPLHLQATALDSLGRTGEALAIMQDCCELFSDDATSWYLLGLAAAAEQDYQQCKQALRTALRLQPAFPAAERNLQAILDFERQQQDQPR